jgi:cystathionine beta-lyase/cystathionine gamma-synthase
MLVPENAASSPPLFQASSYEFTDLDDVDEIYAGNRAGAIYGRYGGPNGGHFESALAELEGAAQAVGAASGMAAISAALHVWAGPSRPVVCAADLYGGTQALLENDFQLNGHQRVSVDIGDLQAVENALKSTGSGVLYVEALSNPLLRVADLPSLARLARQYGARLIVDATFATPIMCRPLEHGVDLVVHSVGKYLGGHGDVGAGVVAGSADACAPIRQWLIRNGATIPHFEAWLACACRAMPRMRTKSPPISRRCPPSHAFITRRCPRIRSTRWRGACIPAERAGSSRSIWPATAAR